MQNPTPSLGDIEKIVSGLHSTKKLQKLLNRSKESRDPLVLNFKEIGEEKQVAEYLYNRIHGGKGWKNSPDLKLRATIMALQRRSLEPSKSMKPQALSRADFLLLGVSDPANETASDVLSFLKTLILAKEAGTSTISLDGLPKEKVKLDRIARKFIFVPVEVLQARVQRIIDGNKEREAQVAKVLAAQVRQLVQQDKSLIKSNIQLTNALKQYLAQPNRIEAPRVTKAVSLLDSTRSFAIREINDSLLAADETLRNLGYPDQLSVVNAITK